MKKIGILTLYYGNCNYGALLQSYALQYTLNNLGYDSLQIAYSGGGFMFYNGEHKISKLDRLRTGGIGYIRDGVVQNVGKYLSRRYKNYDHDLFAAEIKNRKEVFKRFEEQIPHTEVVNDETIKNISDEFECFVVGSDQVWNPDFVTPAFVLDFDKNKKAISYAASIGKKQLCEAEKAYFAGKLSRFSAISVREKAAIDLLRELTDVPAEWVLDPTLLLTKEQWDEVAEPYDVEGEYLLTYFLGDSKKQRQAAEKYASEHNLKVVSFPHIMGYFRHMDKDFGDVQIYDASPAQFIYLIKHASFVVTDSFHMCVFSIIYNIPFAVFDRFDYMVNRKMSSRIKTLLDMFGISERFVKHKNLDNLVTLNEVDLREYTIMREKSISYLKNNI